MNRQPPIIELENISFSYLNGHPVLHEVDFKFYPGDRVGLVAPNGSGKTTLFHLIMGLLRPTAGVMRIFGRTVSKERDFIPVRRKIGLLFQDSDDQLFSPTVMEDVAFGPLNLGKGRAGAVRIAEETLASLGLSHYGDRITFTLSGGEKRLVSLATVLAMRPEVLLLDEPVSGLDAGTRERIIAVLGDLEISLFLISHNLDFLSKLTHKVYTMEGGKINVDPSVHLHEHRHIHPHGTYPHEHS